MKFKTFWKFKKLRSSYKHYANVTFPRSFFILLKKYLGSVGMTILLYLDTIKTTGRHKN